MASDKVKNLIIIAIIAAVGVFYLATVREGHEWGDDFSMYINLAKNITEGVSYENTGYIYNRFYPYIGPKTYPPVFPILLSPVYRWHGLDLTAMKIEIIIMFLLFLPVFFLSFRKALPFRYLAVMIAVIGFNPYFWNFKDNILADIPFVLFFYASLLVIHKFHNSQKGQFLYAVLAGFLIYLSCETKNLGLLLILALFIYDTLRFKKLTRFSIITACALVFFISLQVFFLKPETSFLDQLKAANLKTIINNLFLYTARLSSIWDNGYSKIFRICLFLASFILAVTGYRSRVRQGITIFEIAPVIYVILIIIWPVHAGMRYLISLAPLYIFYVFAGIYRSKPGYLFGVFIMLIVISYAGKYSKIDYGPMPEGIGKKESAQLFEYIKNNTAKEAVFIFQKPRALALYTDRSASVYHRPEDDKELWKYFRDIRVSYIIAGEPFEDDHRFLQPFIERYRNNFEEAYSNQDFKVYRIKNLPPL